MTRALQALFFDVKPAPGASRARWEAWGAFAILAIIATVAYWPALHGGFVWDDDTILTANPLVKAADGVYRMWLTTDAIDYWPVTNTSFWLEWRLWGLHAAGYHVTNLLLHILSSWLVWRILRRLAIPGAFIAALVFVVHPVNVESVAWITQRKNTLSMCFFLSSIVWYLVSERRRAATSRFNAWYWLSLAAFLLAMLSKASVVMLPLVLLLMVWWEHTRITRSDLIRTAPFFVAAGALSLVNLWFRSHSAGGVIRHATAIERVLGAGAAVWFYLLKAVVPSGLTFIYPLWIIRAGNLLWWLPLVAAVALTAALVRFRDRPAVRAALFAWTFFVLGLIPILGFTDVYFMRYSLVADHYQYIAILGLIGLASAALVTTARRTAAPTWMASAAVVAGIAALSGLTWRQGLQYQSAETLYHATLDRNPECWLAYNNLGTLRLNGNGGDARGAVPLFEKAIAINPEDPEAHTNLGVALSRIGQREGSVRECRAAVQLDPVFAEGHNNLGNALTSVGKLDEALTEYQRAEQLKPRAAGTHNNLGNLLRSLNRLPEAMAEHATAIRLDPDYAEAHDGYGIDLQISGDFADALVEQQIAVRLQADSPDAHAHLGEAFRNLDRPSEAVSESREALRLQPDNEEAHRVLARSLDALGRTAEALPHYEEAARLSPGSASTEDEWADALRRSGRINEAMIHLQRAVALQPDYGPAHFHLGYILQSQGRLEPAVAQYEAALKYDASAEVQNNMGVALLELGRRSEAIAHFREAVRLQPDDSPSRDNLTRALSGGQ